MVALLSTTSPLAVRVPGVWGLERPGLILPPLAGSTVIAPTVHEPINVPLERERRLAAFRLIAPKIPAEFTTNRPLTSVAPNPELLPFMTVSTDFTMSVRVPLI